MAKQQSTSEKSSQKDGRKCNKCGEITQPTLYVSINKVSDVYKFSEKRIKICKCNEKEFLS